MSPRLRSARAEDATELTDLALRSKAMWGYDDGFLERCRAELTVAPAAIARHPTRVLEIEGRSVGFFQLRSDGAAADVALFFVDPRSVRRGYGRLLWDDLESCARAHGVRRLLIDADPHAEPFYRAMGATPCGERRSGSIPGRMLPQLEKLLTG